MRYFAKVVVQATAIYVMGIAGIIYQPALAQLAKNSSVNCGNVGGSTKSQFPKNSFDKCGVSFAEVISGGPPRDGIPSIDNPRFEQLSNNNNYAAKEPAIVLTLNNQTKVYPLSVLMWHEIVNDELGGIPVAVTFCPLCNASLVFDRTVRGRVLDFGTTGRLRKSDLIMYDRQTESWWQQFSGNAIIGSYLGKSLKLKPAKVISILEAKQKYPKAKVLLAPDNVQRPYGTNPYVGYDSSDIPFLYSGDLPENIRPLERVVVVGNNAWGWEKIKQDSVLYSGDIRISWKKGVASSLDKRSIANSRDVGSVIVERKNSNGKWQLTEYKVTFAFVFHAFNPRGKINI